MPTTAALPLRMHRLLPSLSLAVLSFSLLTSALLAQLPSSLTTYPYSDSAPSPLPSRPIQQARRAVVGVRASPSRPVDCPAELEPKCSCVLLQSEKIGIFCDEAPSLEAVVDSLSTIQVPIHTLYITNTPIPTLKANSFPDPLTVHKLYIVNATLSSVEEGAFSGPLLNSLEELELSHCALTTIPIAGVGELRALRSLDLSSNRIESVQPYTFLYYQARNLLENLDLTANSLQQFAAESLLGLESLKRLVLDKNHFRSIPTQALRALSTTLEELTLSVNQIEFVGPEDLPPMPKLRSLALEVNRIGYIEPEFFQQAPQLLYLYLSHNAFTTIDPEMFEPIGALRVLAMNKNMISRLGTETFQFTPSLVRLELADNFISEIAEGTFQSVGRTQYISLARNRLRRVPKQMFSSLPLLITLDLNGNFINQVEDFAFSSLPSLQMLDLARNQIAHFSSNTLYKTFEHASAPSSPHIARVMNLHDNPLACDEDLVWLVKWLAERPSMQITAPGNAPTSCASPPSLRGVPLREVNATAIEPKSVLELQIAQRRWPSQSTNTVSTTASTPLSARQTSTRWPDARPSAGATTTTTPTPVRDNKGQQQAKIADTSIAVMLIVATLVLIGLAVVLLIFVKIFVPSSGRRKASQPKSLPSNLSRSMSPSPPLPFLLRHNRQQQQQQQTTSAASRAPPRDYHSPASQQQSRANRIGGGVVGTERTTNGLPPPVLGVSALRSSIMSGASQSYYSQSQFRPHGSSTGPTFKVYYGDSTEEWRRPKAVESHWRF